MRHGRRELFPPSSTAESASRSVEINAGYLSMAPIIVTTFGLAAMSGARFRHIASAAASLGRTLQATG